MSDVPDLAETRAVLREFDLGPLPALDLDEVVRRGHRRRRTAAVQRSAAVVVVVLVASAGFAAAHAHSTHTPPPVSTVSPTPSPSPSPTTAAERVLAVMNAVTAADSVHVVAGLAGGSTLDVVVTKDGAQGTLTHQGKTYTYLGVGGALYIKGEAFDAFGLLSPTQVAAERGRWVLMTTGPLNMFMNLTTLGQWFYPQNGTALTLGQTTTINGTPAIALVNNVNPDVAYVEVDAPYLPVLVEDATHVNHWVFSQWNASAPGLPSAPAPADVYNPLQG